MFTRRAALWHRAAVGTLLGGTFAIGLGRPRVLAAEKQPNTSTLSSLYGEAVEAMVDVPGCDAISSQEGVLYLAPASGTPAPVEWPKLISRSVIYSLTAWNSNGQTAPDATNAAANIRLEADIESLRLGVAQAEAPRPHGRAPPLPCLRSIATHQAPPSPRLRPRAMWRSFGFNDKEGWREEGFSLAYDPAERRFARNEVGRLAQRYRQAAFYVRMGWGWAWGVELAVAFGRELAWGTAIFFGCRRRG
jgi:hypothetical protein